jgi:hypothetical protein
MSCCGEKRALLKAKAANARARHTPSQASPVPTTEATQVDETVRSALRYLGAGSISVCGPHSGRVYYFAREGDATLVDKNDLDALMRTRLFVLEDS